MQFRGPSPNGTKVSGSRSVFCGGINLQAKECDKTNSWRVFIFIICNFFDRPFRIELFGFRIEFLAMVNGINWKRNDVSTTQRNSIYFDIVVAHTIHPAIFLYILINIWFDNLLILKLWRRWIISQCFLNNSLHVIHSLEHFISDFFLNNYLLGIVTNKVFYKNQPHHRLCLVFLLVIVLEHFGGLWACKWWNEGQRR